MTDLSCRDWIVLIEHGPVPPLFRRRPRFPQLGGHLGHSRGVAGGSGGRGRLDRTDPIGAERFRAEIPRVTTPQWLCLEQIFVVETTVPLNRPALSLGSGPRGVQNARRWVVDVCTDIGREDLAECAELGVSELVTNALLHADAPYDVRVRGTREHPRVEVRDGSQEPPV